MILDPHQLRTFLAFAEAGTLTRAAEIVGRSASAVTSQMQALEAQIGEPLLAPAGRRLQLTPVGQELVGHARRILDAHRHAALSLRGARQEGPVRLGTTQDFAEAGLPELLAVFARTHPRVRLDLRVGRSAELAALMQDGALDLTIAAHPELQSAELISWQELTWQEPTVWLVRAGGLTVPQDPLPLALLDAPCGFRTAALNALERAGLVYRIAASSQNLSGLLAAVRAGLAVTLRTARSVRDGIAIPSTGELDLPPTEPIAFSLRLGSGASAAVQALAELMADPVSGLSRPVTVRDKHPQSG
jgi:DNA-binding transcriptional LysR family regulator